MKKSKYSGGRYDHADVQKYVDLINKATENYKQAQESKEDQQSWVRLMVTNWFGGYKISPGIHHRKLAAAINFLRSLGFTSRQMQYEPLRTLIVTFGQWPESIKDTVNGAVINNIPPMLEGIKDIPAPAGNRGSYQKPPDGTALDPIVQEVFGPVPGFGTKLKVDDLYLYAPMQAGANVPPTFDQKAKDLAETNNQNTGINPPVFDGLSDEDLAALKPLKTTMTNALLVAGFVPPTDIEGLAMLFYEKIVRPMTGGTYSNTVVDKNIVNAILSFVSTLINKKESGEPLTDQQEKIANDGGAAVDKEEKKLLAGLDLTGNPLVFGLVIVILITLFKGSNS